MKSIKTRIVLLALAGLFIISLLAACGSQTSQQSAQTSQAQETNGEASQTSAQPSVQPVKLRLADLGANTANLFVQLGKEKGIFTKYGVDLEIVSFLKGGPEAISAAASGQVDLGSIGTPILTGISKSVPIKVVGSPPQAKMDFVLVARNDIKSVEDLKGKNVGVSSIGGGQQQALQVILKAKGMKEDDVKVIAAGSGTGLYQAIQSGQLAGAVMSEPYVSKTELDGIGHTLEEAVNYYGEYQHSYIFATDKYIESNPETIENFFKAYKESVAYAKDHPDELIALGKEKLGLDENLLKVIVDKDIARWDLDCKTDLTGLANAVKILKDLGNIDKDSPLTPEQYVDKRFVK